MKSKQFKNNFKRYLIIVFSLFNFYYSLTSDVFAFNINRTTLPNGLIVLHSENHSLPVVMVTLIIKAGQIHEPVDKAGLANLVAELLTEGTETRKARDISEEIDFIGASLDASAGSDYTAVTLSVLKKDVKKGFDVFSDILLHPAFPHDEIERKKERIKGFLIKLEEEPSFLAERAFKREIYGKHPYGRVLEGSIETLDTIKRVDISKFYSDYFSPNNSILSVVGDLTHDELNNLLRQYLNAWKKKDIPRRKTGKSAMKNKKAVIKIDKDLTQANIITGGICISRDNPDYYAVAVMNYILGGGGFSSRLMQSIRDKMGLAYDVHSFFSAHKEAGSFQIRVQTKNESANTVVEEILKQIDWMRKELISEQELADAKSYLTGSFKRRLDTNRKIADFAASVEFFDLGLDYVEKYPVYINSVTKDDVLRVAKKYLDPEKFVLAVVANQKKALLKY